MRKGILIILDGYGEGKAGEFNAVKNAKTPTLHGLKNYSYSLLKTHGESVGLFENEMGGSEVGHMTIGAGRVVPSTAKKIRDDILSKEFDKNKVLNSALSRLEKMNGNLHLFGLMSDKNIHSNISHALRIIDLAKDKVKNLFIHFVTDGRDSGVHDSEKYIKNLKKHIKNIKNCHFLSVSGRFYAMDRENYQGRTEKAFNAMFNGSNQVLDAEKYIVCQHNVGINDQYIIPASIKCVQYKGVTKNDCLLFFNFREDRLRQIVKMCEKLPCEILTMADVNYSRAKSMYPNKIVKHTLSEYLSKNKIAQVKISETTKYAHVTYFLNGGREASFDGEERIHVPAIKTDDQAKTPNMQAKAITAQTVKCIKNDKDAIIVNFSNADMIGHTGNYQATVKALECVDKCVKKIIKIAKKHDYFVMITADHGNAEDMVDKSGNIQTAHTLNPVLCMVVDETIKLKKQGELKDVAPTFVQLLGLKPNKYFEGQSLIVD